jgi:hypothetical protein
VSGSLTPCPACGRETQTTDDGRCYYCGQLKPVPAEAPSTLTGPPPPEPSVFEDLRPQLVAAALSALIAVIGVIAGSSLLLVIAAALLLASVVAKIVADGW